MNKQTELQAMYKAGRNNLLIMLVLTAVNIVLTITKADVMFLFTAFFPYIAADLAMISAMQEFKGLILAVGCFLPLGLLLVCYLMSAKPKNYGWLIFSAMLFTLDTFYMVAYIFDYGFETSFIMAILFHVLILWQVIRGSKAGRQLAHAEEFGEAIEDIPVLTAENTLPVRNDSEVSAVVKSYNYDRRHARENKTNKLGQLFLGIIGYVAALFAVVFATIELSDYIYISDKVMGSILLIYMFGSIAVLVVWAFKISPFIEANLAYFTVSCDGLLSRSRNEFVTRVNTTFYNLEIIEEKKNCWRVRYVTPLGMVKKDTIPKAYPGLEEFMKDVPRV